MHYKQSPIAREEDGKQKKQSSLGNGACFVGEGEGEGCSEQATLAHLLSLPAGPWSFWLYYHKLGRLKRGCGGCLLYYLLERE